MFLNLCLSAVAALLIGLGTHNVVISFGVFFGLMVLIDKK